jgi:hypothetical protein
MEIEKEHERASTVRRRKVFYHARLRYIMKTVDKGKPGHKGIEVAMPHTRGEWA